MKIANESPFLVDVPAIDRESGKMRTGILLWLLGVPIPIILLIWLVSSCF